MSLGQVLLELMLGFGMENGQKKISTVGTLRSQHSPLLVEEQLISEHWEQPLIRASRARNVDSAERRHGQHEPKPGHVQKSSAGSRVATVGVYFLGETGSIFHTRRITHTIIMFSGRLTGSSLSRL